MPVDRQGPEQAPQADEPIPPADRGASAEDAKLMRSFQSGNEDAYDELVRRYLPFVSRHAYRYVQEQSAAEDVAQEVFLRLYRSRDLFREDTNFRGWIATITTRLALNELRTRRRKHWKSKSSLDGTLEGQDWRPGNNAPENPEARAVQEEVVDAVRAAVDRLPEKQRQAIWLQRFEGWDLKEVGAALDLSVPAVKSLLFRARAALMKELSGFAQENKPSPRGSAS